MKIAAFSVAALFCALTASSISAQTPGSHYKIANRINVEGDGGWDYLAADDATGRLFVSHATVVQVVDAKSGKIIGTIPDTKGVHGIAVASDVHKGFTSNGKDSSVTVFDLSTLKVLGKVPVTGLNPDAILYDAFSNSVYAFNGKTSNATVIDAKSEKVAATISLDGKPEFAASDGQGSIYDNIEDKNLVDVIDAKTMKVTRKFAVAPGEGPSALALDVTGNRLFIGCGNKLMVIADAKTGKVLASLPIGDHVDAAAWDPSLKRAYASCGDGTLTVVQEQADGSYKVLETVVTQKGAKTMALDKKTHHIYLPTAEFGPAPAPTAENSKPRPQIKPGTFMILDMEMVK
jgi:DNA-binding beta-propeller fold protein YncE